MERRYYTKKGSVYIQTVNGHKDVWLRQEPNGQIHCLAGGLPISVSRLRELIQEYPSTLLDKTYCLDSEMEQEFFEDARREQYLGPLAEEPTVIFFITQVHGDRHEIGCSSAVVRIEETE